MLLINKQPARAVIGRLLALVRGELVAAAGAICSRARAAGPPDRGDFYRARTSKKTSRGRGPGGLGDDPGRLANGPGGLVGFACFLALGARPVSLDKKNPPGRRVLCTR